jgi:thymidylate kinase
MTTGRLFILEGPDGAGKSTTAKKLVETLKASGSRASLFAFPGNEPGTLGKLVHDLHHDSARHGVARIDPTSLQVLPPRMSMQSTRKSDQQSNAERRL